MKRAFQICLLTVVVLVIYDGVGVSAKAPIFKTSYTDTKYEKILPLSKKGKNVIVIMLDRAIGAYVPYLFAETASPFTQIPCPSAPPPISPHRPFSAVTNTCP